MCADHKTPNVPTTYNLRIPSYSVLNIVENDGGKFNAGILTVNDDVQIKETVLPPLRDPNKR